jgi:signal transduction histidine kinase
MDFYRTWFQKDPAAQLLFEQGRLVDANESACQFLCTSLEVLQNRSLESLFPERLPEAKAIVETIQIDEYQTLSVVVRILTLDEQRYIVRIRQPMLNELELAAEEQVADTQDFRKKLERLNDVSLRLSQTDSLDELYRSAILLGRQELGFDRLAILLIDLETKAQIGTWGTDDHGQLKDERDWRAPIENTPWVKEALEHPDYCYFWDDIDLLNYGQVVGRGWNGMANLFDGHEILGWLAADNLLERKPLTPALAQIFRLYALNLSQIILRKRTELELIATNDTLEQKVKEKTQALHLRLQEVERMQRQMIDQEKHASLGNLVAGVAHEINTPLGNSLVSLSQLQYVAKQLQKDVALGKLTRTKLANSCDEIVESVDLLDSNLHRAVELVRSFKQLASDQVDDRTASINLHDLIANIFASFHTQYKNRPIECINNVSPELRFQGAPAVITQIVTNLFENGLNHAFPVSFKGKGKIGFAAELDQGMLTLTYLDNGRGVPNALLQSMLEPFQTSNRGSFQGLGLTIIERLVRDELKGDAVGNNVESGGFQFKITFSVVPDVDAENRSKSSTSL